MPKLTKKAIRYGRTDTNYRKASLLKMEVLQLFSNIFLKKIGGFFLGGLECPTPKENSLKPPQDK